MRSMMPDASISRPGLIELLDSAFPGMAKRVRLARLWGVDWTLASTGFVVPGPDGPYAHAGLLELPLRIHGHWRDVGYLHAVCTRADQRGRGFARAVIEAALEASDALHDTQILLTSEPALYERFGFRTIVEHGVRLELADIVIGRNDGLVLDPVKPGHSGTLARILGQRVAVSDVLGVGAERAVYTLNEAQNPPTWIEDLDVLVSWELDGGLLRLYDVAGAKLPRLADLLSHAPGNVRQVEFHFSPDCFLGEPLPHGATVWPRRHGDLLMARGPFVDGDAHIMLPRPWR